MADDQEPPTSAEDSITGFFSSTGETPSTAPEKTNVVAIKPKKHTKNYTKLAHRDVNDPDQFYDAEHVQEFLDTVFHTPLEEGCEILTWSPQPGKGIGFPNPSHVRLKDLHLARAPLSLYYGTSSVRPNKTDGKHYNRKESFSALHVVVLDDIGTKIPKESIPAELEPTYIIESSEGNFQYGYVLAEPITDLHLAECLVKIVCASGLTDPGGAMPTKIVRLPDGINGKLKPKEKRLYPVTLVDCEGPYWTPEQLISHMQTDAVWADIVAGVPDAMAGTHNSNVGVSSWRSDKTISGTMNGLVDPVLEWLHEDGVIIHEGSPWYVIECPWCEDHTHNGAPNELSAYYSPLGMGDGDFGGMRGFKCYHGHCVGNKTKEFLAHVSANGGPELPVVDPVADLIRNYVYDAKSQLVWRVGDCLYPEALEISGFNGYFPRSIKYVNAEGKTSRISEANMWHKSPNRMSVFSRVLDPTTTDRIVYDDDNIPRLNTFTRPDFGDGEYDQTEVDTFLEYLHYLIPIEEEREFFLDWLAAKYQNCGFRGPAILMIAPSFGTGRDTLAAMIFDLFGRANVTRENLTDMAKTEFTEWMAYSIVVVSETKAGVNDGRGSVHTLYEKVKEIFDPRPMWKTVNPKYGKKYDTMVYTSGLLFSNHIGAMAAVAGDRRILVISNPREPAPPEYFEAVDKWIKVKEPTSPTNPRPVPRWAKHVGRYLATLKPDLLRLHAPVPMTVGKERMLASTKSDLDKLVDAVFLAWPTRTLTHAIFEDVVHKVRHRVDSGTNPHFMRIIKEQINERSGAIFRHETNRIKVGKKRARPRIIYAKATSDEVTCFGGEIADLAARQTMSTHLSNFDLVSVVADVNDALDDMDVAQIAG